MSAQSAGATQGRGVIERYVRRLQHALGRHYCPICEHRVSAFQPHGSPPRPGARCPRCRSLERQRFSWFFLKKVSTMFDGQPKRMLHFAPERFLAERFSVMENVEYHSADLNPERAKVASEKVDITDIPYPEKSFDVIYCSHVLEHVPNDELALRELRRVISDDGWAMIQVPILAEKTHEDLSIDSPEERTRLYGQWDHVRACGLDYADRIRAAGFTVKIYQAGDIASPAERERMGFPNEVPLFYCTPTLG